MAVLVSYELGSCNIYSMSSGINEMQGITGLRRTLVGVEKTLEDKQKCMVVSMNWVGEHEFMSNKMNFMQVRIV